MGSLLSRMPSVDKSTACIIIPAISGAIFYFADNLGETTLKLLHLGAFSTWFGTQMWVTFVAGIVMYNALPRQMFGMVQSKLFPKYFMSGVGLSSITLATYMAHNPISIWSGSTKTQGLLLSATLAFNLSSYLLIEPIVTAQMFKCHKYEKAYGDKGQEIVPPNEGFQNDKEYMSLRRTFYKLHGVSSLVNMASLGSTVGYLWYLQKRLSLY